MLSSPSSFLRASTTKSIARQFAQHNTHFRQFLRAPLGRAALQTTSMLMRMQEQPLAATNTASQLGQFMRGGEAYGSAFASNMMGALFQQAFGRTKTTVTTAESERSQTTSKLWNSSRSE